MRDEDVHPITTAFVLLIAFAGGIFALWCTVIAFVGGTIPVFGWEMEGSVGAGLLFLFIVDPIVTTIFYWIGMMIALPLNAIFRGGR